ncbi:hypothetical protein [Desulfobacca acetoxidans]
MLNITCGSLEFPGSRFFFAVRLSPEMLLVDTSVRTSSPPVYPRTPGKKGNDKVR